MHLAIARRPRRGGPEPEAFESGPADTPWARYCAKRCASSTAAILHYFLGLAGAHRFYVGKTGTGATMMGLSLGAAAGILLAAMAGSALGAVFILPLFTAGFWAFIDTYTLRDMVREHNRDLARAVGLAWTEAEAWERHQEDWFGTAR